VYAVEVESVVKRFGSITAVAGVSFAVGKGEVLGLLGPSGCGKTTVLRLIAGLEIPDEGTVRVNGKVATDDRAYVPPASRGIGMVFQDLALWPHMRVEQHVSFVLNKLDRSKRRQRVRELMELCRLTARRRAYPHELSGGEKQRLAIARALATGPAIVLLDEPLTGLDAELRDRMLAEILRLRDNLDVTIVYVTQHEHEVLAVADRTVHMRDGQVTGSADMRTDQETC